MIRHHLNRSAAGARAEELLERFGTSGGSAADLTVLLAIVWPVGIAAVFAALSVHRYRNLAR